MSIKARLAGLFHVGGKHQVCGRAAAHNGPMHRITRTQGAALFDTASTRRLELTAQAGLPPHSLMRRAGLAVARLALALRPHARCIWIACGPGNNGGDGFEAAAHLQRWGQNYGLHVVVTWTETHMGEDGGIKRLPPDAQVAHGAALAAGVRIADLPPAHFDLSIDALLGLGACYDANRPASALMAQWLGVMHTARAPCLAVDLPTWLDADTGSYPDSCLPRAESVSKLIAPQAVNAWTTARFTLSFLTLKPGLFTASGRDAAGEVWFDDLGVSQPDEPPCAWLMGDACVPLTRAEASHASHKGSFGDVAVVGGESTAGSHMVGAAVLAARAALHAGAGRVFVSLLASRPVTNMPGVEGSSSNSALQVDILQPELMFRQVDALELTQQVIVAGCGGGHAIHEVLPQLLAQATRLVLDADALNAIADSPALQAALIQRGSRTQADGATTQTVLTPHPLEAARLLGTTSQAVQSDRLIAAQSLAERFCAVIVLKGSGTVVAAPGEIPRINATGNALLATAGTGDVLAGMVGACLANGLAPTQAACSAVFTHGRLADRWAERSQAPLTASALALQQ